MNIDIILVKSCCGWISLRTGCKFFGYMSLVGSLLLGIVSGLEIIVMAKYNAPTLLPTVVDLVLDILAQTFQVITSTFLLMGAYQEQAKFMPPWLFSTVIMAILEVFFLPSFLVRWSGINLHVLQMHWIALTIVVLADDVFGLLVVYSYYRSLTSQTGNNLV